MRTIFINANEQKVEEVQIENELHAFYKQIQCDVIQCIDMGESHTLVCDEEGRLKDLPWGFRLAGPTIIAGNALIVVTTEDGDFTDAQVPRCLISRNIEFIDIKKSPLPKPEWKFIAF